MKIFKKDGDMELGLRDAKGSGKKPGGCAVIMIILVVIVVFIIAAASSCSSSQSGSPSTDAAAVSQSVKPEQIVSFKTASFACTSEDYFKEAVAHAAAHEETLFAKMFDDSLCVMIPIEEKFKILSVDSGFTASYVQFINVKSDPSADTTFWADASFIKNQ